MATSRDPAPLEHDRVLTVSRAVKLVQGVTTLAIQSARWNGHVPEGTFLVIEVDEGALRIVAPAIQPRVLTVAAIPAAVP